MRLLTGMLLLLTITAWAVGGPAPEFGQVNNNLYRGGQPGRAGFVQLRQMGIRTVVDLRAEQSDIHLIRGLGFRYVHLDEIADIWRPSNIAAFLRLATDPANYPIFVHCNTGQDRTGEMVAVYRMVVQGWSQQQAMDELHQYKYRLHFSNVLKHLEVLDPAAWQQEEAHTLEPPVFHP